MTTYTRQNYATKKALKDAVKAGEQVTLFNPGLGEPPINGRAFVSGPHYPKPHSWYAECKVTDGKVTAVK